MDALNENVYSPKHYTGFTNGAEPIDIGEHLTGNGYNIVKYGVRGCRIDGVVKHDKLEDLYKCRNHVDREIQRLEGMEK